MTDEVGKSQILQSLSYHLNAKGLSTLTEEHYCQALRRFMEWMDREKIPSLSAVRQGDIERYMTELRGRRLRPATIRYQFSGLQAVFKWHASREGYASPMAGMESPKVPESVKDVVEIPDLKRVIDTVFRRQRYRDATLIALLAETGMRISEALKLQWRDVDWKAMVITVADTKNGYARRVPFSPGLAEKLDILRGAGKDKGVPLFVSQKGNSLTRSGAEQMIRKAFTEQGIPGISPHDLRHTMATKFMDANPHGHHILKAIGGWRSDSMVQRYSRKGEAERALEAFRQGSPLKF